jgi:hypothetical protein
MCTCKAAANTSYMFVNGKNNKILPIPETMQGISTSADSKGKKTANEIYTVQVRFNS